MSGQVLTLNASSPHQFESGALLGKRKHPYQDTLTVTRHEPLDDSSDDEYQEATSDYADGLEERLHDVVIAVQPPIAGPSKPTKVPRSRSASVKSVRRKSYICNWDGCDKAYTKPCRLEEHFRSHTGERPFPCPSCDKSFLRKVHLQAHLRSHASAEERPLVCGAQEGCDKRFWTQQQLRVHEDMHRGEKPYKCQEEGCDEGFTKHSQLRSHTATCHREPGTKPFECEHDGCSRSFATSQKLRAHLKTHDDQRYACYDCHPETGEYSPLYFRTWSDYQIHLRERHPPTCNECGKSFKESRSLRTHMQVHGITLGTTVPESASESGMTKRRKLNDRPFACHEPECGLTFKSAHLLKAHHRVKHEGKLDYVCSNAHCDKRFGYKRNLQHHLRTCKADSGFDTAQTISGTAYLKQASKKSTILPCPWTFEGKACEHVFSRMYDLERHLRSIHGVAPDLVGDAPNRPLAIEQ